MSTFPADLDPDEALAAMLAAWNGDAALEAAAHELRRDAIVEWAVERCPHYRGTAKGRAFDEIPVLTREDVRERFGRLVADGVPAERLVRKTTSGSTGRRLLFLRDSLQGPLEDIAARRALERVHGVPPGAAMVWLSAIPHVEPSWDRPVHGISTLRIDPSRIPEEPERWSSFPSYFLYGYASALGWLASEIEARGLEVAVPPVCTITTSDMLTDVAAAHLRRVFGAPVHSWYGSHELNGFAAGTLPGTSAYAFNPFLCWVEVLDEEGRPTPEGAVGRLVVTDLNNRAFPLIRYDTGDLALASGGRRRGGWPLVERIEGRSSEVLHLPNGGILSAVSLGQLLFVANDWDWPVREFHCAQVAPERLELQLGWWRPPKGGEREAIAEAVRSAFEIETTVVDLDGREPPIGKRWVVRREF